LRTSNFDNYIIGEFNKIALKAANQALVNSKFNIVFIYGGVGVGKTHLLNAIGNKFLKDNPEGRVVYYTSDDIIRKIYSVINKGVELEQLKDEFISYDLLLVDDIQMFSKKEKINEVFFSIFNKFVSLGKVIVITSDKEPDQIKDIEPRIISRLIGGLCVKIEKPDVVVLKTIASKIFEEIDSKIKLTPDALDVIVGKSNKDIRILAGIIDKILFQVESNPITTIDLQKVFDTGKKHHREDNFATDPNLVIDIVCNNYNINPDTLKSSTRVKNIVKVRNICMYILKEKLHLSLNEIGKYLGGRSHTTVIQGITSVKESAIRNPDLAGQLEILIKHI
jgi:chromosomal replication initiator protein